MAKEAANTRSLVDYVVSVAPVGSTLPTDATSALDAAFDEVGLVSDSGFTRGRTENVTEVFDAAGRKVRTFRSQSARTFTFTTLEDNETVRTLTEPGALVDTTDPTETSYTVHDAPPARRAVVLEFDDTNTAGDAITRRVVIEEAEVVPSGQPVLVDGQIEGQEFTVSTMKNAAGVHYVEYVTVAA